MSFVETIVEQLAKSGFENISKPQAYDTSDNTFSKLLEKQLSIQEEENKQNLLGEIGIPSGLIIEPYDPDNLNLANTTLRLNNDIDISEVEVKDFKFGDYFDNFMNESNKNDSSLMSFVKRYAANSYENQGKNFIYNINDFADGLTGKS